jgi:LmbE family N-acetylglucosaminyl deacetylase
VNKFYDSIYLSPHLDDAALSCGGQIFSLANAGRAVLIVNVMAGDPSMKEISSFAQSLHERWDLKQNTPKRRRAEDAYAARILRADSEYWAIPDCIYRVNSETGAALYSSEESLFGEVNDIEDALVDQLAACIQKLPPHRSLVTPLGVGNHVDHQITRRAAEQAQMDRLFYYEEYPYAANQSAVEAVFREDGAIWRSTIVPLSEAAVEAKIEAVAAYKSQLSTFFEDRADLEKAIRQQVEEVGGERIWRRI